MATASPATEEKSAPRRAARKPAAAKSAAAAATRSDAATGAPASTRPAAKPAAKKPASAGPAKASANRKSARTGTARKKPAAENRQSRDSSMTGKEHDDHAARAWDLAERIGMAMFVTWDGARQRSRPLAAKVDKDEGAIYFLTDIAGEKDDQIAEFPYVSVNFADNRKSRYVVFSGKATLSNDRARIRDLWSPFAKAWWDSPEDPSIRVIRMVPEDAELWDSPGRIVSTVTMLAAAVTGKSPRIGENAKIVLQ